MGVSWRIFSFSAVPRTPCNNQAGKPPPEPPTAGDPSHIVATIRKMFVYGIVEKLHQHPLQPYFIRVFKYFPVFRSVSGLLSVVQFVQCFRMLATLRGFLLVLCPVCYIRYYSN